jgi:hypothetical protein
MLLFGGHAESEAAESMIRVKNVEAHKMFSNAPKKRLAGCCKTG